MVLSEIWAPDAMTDRKKPGAVFWATVLVVVVLVAYPLSFGPAFGVMSRKECPSWLRRSIIVAYRPCFEIADYGHGPVRDALAWYAELWSANVQPDRARNPLF
jgi:hypothetical protein